MILSALSLLSKGNQAAFLMNDLSTPALLHLINKFIDYHKIYISCIDLLKKTSPFHNVGTGDQNGGLKQQLLCFPLPFSPLSPSYVWNFCLQESIIRQRSATKKFLFFLWIEWLNEVIKRNLESPSPCMLIKAWIPPHRLWPIIKMFSTYNF